MEIDSERADPASPAEAWRRQRREALGRYVEAEAFEAAADEGDLEPSDATFAAELADRSTHEGAHRDALFAGLLAASAARRRGSVRLAIEPGGREALAERLSTLVPALVDEDAAHDAAGALVELAAAEEAGTLIGEPGEYAPLVVENGHLYRHRDRAAEDRVARAVSNRLVDEWTRDFEVAGESPGPDEIRRHLEAIRATTNPTPTVEQLYGVVTAATSPLSALTGGPGTGKTWLITTLLRLLDALGVAPDDIALAAPTGKAADRLGDQLQERIRASVPERGDTLDLTDAGPGGLARMAAALPEPATLHRLLGYSERRRVFRHDEYRPLSHEYVVVDEASMIDLELMDRLVAAMAPEAKLVLVGDAHQLPAVGSGAVFRDLVPSSIETVDRRLEALPEALETRASDEPLAAQSVVLTENFRMNPDRPGGSRILATARAVREGGDELVFSADADDRSADAPAIIERASFEELTAEGVELYSDLRSDRTPIELLGDWYEDRLAKPARHAREEPITVTDGSSDSPDRERVDALFEGFGANQLLAVSRRRPRGVERLDAELHRRHVEAHDAARDRQFVTGEPVMMTTNDYERGLFNGDRGVILRVRRTPEGRASPRAVFPTRHGYRPFAIGPLARHLDHAWSLTVHKAQGSEFEHVGFVLPDEDIPLLTRELLYTGMTRAERSVVFFGRSELIRRAAARSDERNTGLVERLESTDRPE